MKAILWTKYGPPSVLKLGEIDKPTPEENELLVKIHSATVTPGDCELRRFEMHVLFWLPLRIMMGIFKPKRPILGMELAGEVELVGSQVKKFKIGDQIIAGTGLKFGAYAEYICLNSSKMVALKPPLLGYNEAATLPTAGVNALHYIRRAEIQPGEHILINGAGGCFGTYAVQLAKNLGAIVTAVDSTDKLTKLTSLGADHVVDFTKEDYTKNGIRYDIIFDVVGKDSVVRAMKSLTPEGRYILATPWVLQVLQGIWVSILSKKKFNFGLAREDPEDMNYLADLLESGKLKSVIDRIYPLEDMVEAHTYVESGEKTGNVVISIADKL